MISTRRFFCRCRQRAPARLGRLMWPRAAWFCSLIHGGTPQSPAIQKLRVKADGGSRTSTHRGRLQFHFSVTHGAQVLQVNSNFITKELVRPPPKLYDGVAVPLAWLRPDFWIKADSCTISPIN